MLELMIDEYALEQRHQRRMRSIRIMAYQRSILNGHIMVSIPLFSASGADKQPGDNSDINHIRLYPLLPPALG